MSKYLLCISAIITFLYASSAAAITWGEPDAGEHPNVGSLTFIQNGGGFERCTGTMIAPRVMLTAAHCVSEAGQINDVTYARFEEDALSGIDNYNNPQDWLDAEWLKVETVEAHPLWSDYSGFPYNYDVGVVILEEPYEPTNGFGEIPPLGFLENLVGKDRQSFMMVGYGDRENLPAFEAAYGQRYKGEVRLLEVNSYISGKGEASARFSNNPGIGGGACYGDSGGPTFYRDTNFIVGVTSFYWPQWANPYCVGNEHSYRLDIPETQEFLNGILDEYGD